MVFSCANFASVNQKGGGVVRRRPVRVWELQDVRLFVMARLRRARTSASQIVSEPRFFATSAAFSRSSARWPTSETAVRSMEEPGRPRCWRCWMKAFRKVLAAE